MSDARRAADMRLANGEITLEQHAAIVAALSAAQADPGTQYESLKAQSGEAQGEAVVKWVKANGKLLAGVALGLVILIVNSSAKSNYYDETYRGFRQYGFTTARANCVAKIITDREGPIYLFKSFANADTAKIKNYNLALLCPAYSGF